MTATAQPATGADSNGDPATVGGSITRLNATDGLFLRAEHLAAMQDYARELAFAAGLANGTGVVYGFTVTLSGDAGDKLVISPGLAVDSSGRPLRSRKLAEVSLSGLRPEPDRFWLLKIVPAEWAYGTEKAFGNLCDDPCNGSTIAPWQAEGLTVQLSEDSMPGLESRLPADRRSWLASQYFERERQRGGPWLTPTQAGSPVSSITGRAWYEGNPQPAATGVPIAVVQRVGNEWVLDGWTARRDVGDPPARRSWQWRLAMRPWDVFLAQVLQFQAQLAAAPPVAGEDETVDPRELIANLDEFVQGMAVKPKQLRAVVDALKKAAPTAVASVGGQSLRTQGFVELPPAGFLRVGGEGDDLSAAVTALFGENVDVRVCRCRADYVPHAVEQAQHLDRIPLDSSDAPPTVDILVPDWPTDLAPLKADDYGWVAFVRRRETQCDEEPVVSPVDRVAVYLVEDTIGVDVTDPLTTEVLDRMATQLPPGGPPLGTLEYPAGTWAYPGGELVGQLSLDDRSLITVVAHTNAEERRPLAALRASLFAASFDTGIAAPPVFAAVNETATQEVIVIFKRSGTPPSPG